MIGILLVDDQELFRFGLSKVIKDWDDFEVIGVASNGKEALTLCRKHVPDIVLMDISMPEMDGVEATRIIHAEFPSIKVVMLTVSEEEKDLFAAIKSGASGYILKDTPTRRFRSQLRDIMNDEASIPGKIAYNLLSEFSRTSHLDNSKASEGSETGLVHLTNREMEILKLITAGYSNSEIAEALVISDATVKKHVHNVLEKLQVNNRVEAAVYAVRSGLG